VVELTQNPFYGYRKIYEALKTKGKFEVTLNTSTASNETSKIEGNISKGNTSKAGKSHKKYMYLLKDKEKGLQIKYGLRI
jgi:hypothetical protein